MPSKFSLPSPFKLMKSPKNKAVAKKAVVEDPVDTEEPPPKGAPAAEEAQLTLSLSATEESCDDSMKELVDQEMVAAETVDKIDPEVKEEQREEKYQAESPASESRLVAEQVAPLKQWQEGKKPTSPPSPSLRVSLNLIAALVILPVIAMAIYYFYQLPADEPEPAAEVVVKEVARRGLCIGKLCLPMKN